MTKKLKILLIAVLGVIATVCAGVLAGCKTGLSVEDIKDKYGLKAQVTYFLNSPQNGSFKGGAYVKNMYYPDGTTPYEITEEKPADGEVMLEPHTGYVPTDWYVVKLDDNKPLLNSGEVYADDDVYDAKMAEIGVVSTGEKFDFNTKLKAGDHIYLCADWHEDVRLRLYLDCKDNDFEAKYSVTVGDVTTNYTVKQGEELKGLEYKIDKTTGVPNITSDIKINNYTVYGLYDYETHEPFDSWPVKYPDGTDDDPYVDRKLYVKLIEGTWNIVKTATDVKGMFGEPSSSYYIDRDINCEGTTLNSFNSFSGQIKGNNHSISNFNVQRRTKLNNDFTVSLLGDVTSTAKIENLTFKDFTFSVEGTNTPDGQVKLVCNTIEDGAEISDFNIVNFTMEVKSVRLIFNTSETDWLFGGKDDATYKNIKVTESSLIIYKTEETTTYKTEDLT